MSMSEPKTEFLRWRDLCAWLNAKGFSTYKIRIFKSEGKIRTYTEEGANKRAYYLKSQIKKDVLNEY